MVFAAAATLPFVLDAQLAAISFPTTATTTAVAALAVTRRVSIARDAAGADFVTFLLSQAD